MHASPARVLMAPNAQLLLERENHDAAASYESKDGHEGEDEDEDAEGEDEGAASTTARMSRS